MHKFITPLLGLVTFSMASAAYAEGGLRIRCFDDHEGATIFVNGKDSGVCPTTVFAPAGTVTLTAKKIQDSEYERVFTTEIRVIDDTIKTIDVELSKPQLTAEAKRKREVAEANRQLRAAESGSIEAMKAVAGYYNSGYGVERDPAKSQFWRQQAIATEKAVKEKQEADRTKTLQREAQQGNANSMRQLAERYERGLGVAANAAIASEWRNKADATDLAEKLAREKRETESLLQQAQAKQDVYTMEQLATRYENGIGTPKDSQQAEFWRNQAQARKDELAAQERARVKEEKMNQHTFFVNTSANVKKVTESNLRPNFFEFLLTVCPSLTGASVGGLVSDMVSAPTRTAEIIAIDKEAAYRPAAWANPQSMIAKANLQSSRR